MPRHVTVVLAAVVCPLAFGCSYAVYSPPTRSLPLESAARLPPGRTAVKAEQAINSIVMGSTLTGGSLQVRHGVSETTELAAEGSVQYVHGDSAMNVSPFIVAGRFGVKHAPPGVRHFAFTAGAGAGHHAAGSFAAGDVGLIASYENCWLIPTIAARAWLSVPIANRALDLGAPDSPAGEEVHRPYTTLAFAPSANLRVPLGPHRCDEIPSAPAALLMGAQISFVNDHDSTDAFFGLGVGFEVVF